jgi:hypothetical protein
MARLAEEDDHPSHEMGVSEYLRESEAEEARQEVERRNRRRRRIQ